MSRIEPGTLHARSWKLAITASLTVVTALASLLVRISIPLTGGDNDFGDVVVILSALTFGPVVGGIAGGLGAALADAFGFPAQAPFTLVIRGVEGALTGITSDLISLKRDVLGWAVGAIAMIVGYFLTEAYALSLGVPIAVGLLPLNILQAIVAGVIGVPAARLIRRRLPRALTL